MPTQNSKTTSPPPSNNGLSLASLTIGRLIVMLMSISGLYLLSKTYLSFECWYLFFPVCLIAWPIWEYQREYSLFNRRVLLDGLTKESSKVKGFLWQGTLSKIIQVFIALFWAALLLMSSVVLEDIHWQILFIDAIVLVICIPIVERIIASDIKTEIIGPVARRWPLFWLNFIIVTCAIGYVDFHQGAPESRGLTWLQVIEQAFLKISPQAACNISAWGTASIDALNDLSWHVQASLSDYLPDSMSKSIAWFMFLIKGTIVVIATTKMLLGSVVFLERQTRYKSYSSAASKFPHIFVFTILLLFIPYFILTGRLLDLNTQQVWENITGKNSECTSENTQDIQALIDNIDDDLQEKSTHLKAKIDQEIDQKLDQMFSGLEPGADAFLDWYFSVIGEYSILASLVFDDADTYLKDQLQEKLFSQTDIDAQLAALNTNLIDTTLGELSELADSTDAFIRQKSCDQKGLETHALISENREVVRGSIAVLAGLKVSTTIVSKIAAQSSFKVAGKIITKAAAKAASKGGSAAAAGAAGIACGPLVWVCGPALAIAAWFTVDKIIVEVDESFNREGMKKDMLTALDEQKNEISQQLKATYHNYIDNNILFVTQRIRPVEEINKATPSPE